MKIALVYDRINKWGGAERVLMALHEIWPAAPIFTAVYHPQRATWAKVFQVKTTFLQHFPFAKPYHEFYPWLTPLAFETFSFDGYDVVLSVTSAEAKGIITKPPTIHVCYNLTPTRYLWSGFTDYQRYGLGIFDGIGRHCFEYFAPELRRWDTIASNRPDYYIAISHHVARRIQTYYHRQVESVIYPPIESEKFFRTDTRRSRQERGEYYLVVSRLVGYKRLDIIIEAFNQLGWPLIIIGEGLAKRRLQSQAKRNVNIVSRHLTDDVLVGYYEKCRALVMAADEDFGLVAVEAQACGKPVIAYRQSGVAEVVLDGVTGLLYEDQSVESLVAVCRSFATTVFDTMKCRSNAKRFSKVRFQNQMKIQIEKLYFQSHIV